MITSRGYNFQKIRVDYKNKGTKPYKEHSKVRRARNMRDRSLLAKTNQRVFFN